MKTKMKNVICAMMLGLSLQVSAGDRGHGGDFTEQDIYLTLHEIARDLIDLKMFDFGIKGQDVLSELDKGHFLIVLSNSDILDRNNRKKEALNFAPNEISSVEMSRYGIKPSEKGSRIIIINKPSWDKRIASGLKIKNLTTHELWGAMGDEDDRYKKSSLYLMKMDEISQNPTAYTCEYSYTHGYGSSMKEAFEDMKVAARSGSNSKSAIASGLKASNMCRLNL